MLTIISVPSTFHSSNIFRLSNSSPLFAPNAFLECADGLSKSKETENIQESELEGREGGTGEGACVDKAEMVVRTVAGCYQHLCGADSDSGCGAEPACVPNE